MNKKKGAFLVCTSLFTKENHNYSSLWFSLTI